MSRRQITTLLVSLRKEIAEWACDFEQFELLGAVAFTSPLRAWRARVRAAGGPVKLQGHEVLETFPGCSDLVEAIQHVQL